MIDVHSPHHTPQGWRDFFIHIATIVVGLVIAVSLEQSIEAIHRHHQRRQLVDQLAVAHLQLLKDAENMNADERNKLNWYSEHIVAMRATVEQHRSHAERGSPLTSPFSSPQDSVWLAAKADGSASLLSQQQLIAESELDELLVELHMQIREVNRVRQDSVIPGCDRLSVKPGTLETNYSHGDSNELRDCLAATMSYYYAHYLLFDFTSNIIGADKAIIAGTNSIDAISRSEDTEVMRRRRLLRAAAVLP